MALAVAQTDVGDAPFWVAEKRDVVHLASFRFHLKAHKKLLAGVPRHSAASQSGGQGHQATAIKSPTAPTAPVVRHMEHGLRPSNIEDVGEESTLRLASPPFPPNANGPRALAHTRPREAIRRGRRPKRRTRPWFASGFLTKWTSQDEVAFGPSTLCTHQEASLPPSFQSLHSGWSQFHLPAPRSRIPRGPRPRPSEEHG